MTHMNPYDVTFEPGDTFDVTAVDNEFDSRSIKALKTFNLAEEADSAGIAVGPGNELMGEDVNKLMDHLVEKGLVESATSVN